MFDDRVATTVSWLESFDESLVPTVRPRDGCVFLDLPRPPSADYFFRLTLSDADYSLAAVPAGGPEAEIFWHQSFERLGADSLDAVEPVFREFVRDIISHDSRVTQRRGLLFHRFTCEVLRGHAWERVGGRILALRTSYRVPRIDGRTRVYRAPALVAPTRAR